MEHLDHALREIFFRYWHVVQMGKSLNIVSDVERTDTDETQTALEVDDVEQVEDEAGNMKCQTPIITTAAAAATDSVAKFDQIPAGDLANLEAILRVYRAKQPDRFRTLDDQVRRTVTRNGKSWDYWSGMLAFVHHWRKIAKVPCSHLASSQQAKANTKTGTAVLARSRDASSFLTGKINLVEDPGRGRADEGSPSMRE
eukprot:GSA120T00009450001.1